jgi:hypothetical protein
LIAIDPSHEDEVTSSIECRVSSAALLNQDVDGAELLVHPGDSLLQRFHFGQIAPMVSGCWITGGFEALD